MNLHDNKSQENESRAIANNDNTKKTATPVAQFVDKRPEAVAQLKLQEGIKESSATEPIQLMEGGETEAPALQGGGTPNNTGLPDDLKAGIEKLSGLSMDDVKVHYNSDKPEQLGALAYAQGTDIYIAPGQEEHLAHEAWHVVQQKEGRVAKTIQLKGGVGVNDDSGLEREADVMGARALGMNSASEDLVQRKISSNSNQPIQAMGLEELWTLAESFNITYVALFTAIAAIGISALYLRLKQCTNKEEASATIADTGTKELSTFIEPKNVDELRACIDTRNYPPGISSSGDKRDWAGRMARKLKHKKPQTFIDRVRQVEEGPMDSTPAYQDYGAASSSSKSYTAAPAKSKTKTTGKAAPIAAAAGPLVPIAPPAGYTLATDSMGITAYLADPNRHTPTGVPLDHIISAAHGERARIHRSTNMEGTAIPTYVHPNDDELYTFITQGNHADGIPMITIHEIGNVRAGAHKFR